MSYFRKALFYCVLSICNTVLRGTHFFAAKRFLLNQTGIKVGKGTCIVGPIKIGSMAQLTIGSGNWVGANLTVYGNGSVSIGDNNDIAPDVTFVTGSHEIGSATRRAGTGIRYSFNVKDGNWIGAKATFANGATVGSGVVVGACSLVTKNCIDDHVYAGIPAKVIRKLNE